MKYAVVEIYRSTGDTYFYVFKTLKECRKYINGQIERHDSTKTGWYIVKILEKYS